MELGRADQGREHGQQQHRHKGLTYLPLRKLLWSMKAASSTSNGTDLARSRCSQAKQQSMRTALGNGIEALTTLIRTSVAGAVDRRNPFWGNIPWAQSCQDDIELHSVAQEAASIRVESPRNHPSMIQGFGLDRS